ncbi:thiamine phosphate synthase [Nocardioides campestrisoli]|uniref:thiamine phosphate synthase n=1 Tax=Nocardioides campestrisoli TaxID=2736757 RepID=UPI0015E7B0C3|nr:thiamine phosphate synthase [Nocardioides campestrisoli]
MSGCAPPRVVVLTDAAQLPAGRDLLGTVRACHRAGLEAVVVREHDLEPGARSDLVAALAALPGLRVVSSRVPDPAAHAVHLAAWQPAPGHGPPWGRSCHSAAGVARAARQGAGWATLSPYAATPSKPGYGPLVPSAAYAGHPVPVFALGGVDPGNAASALRAGAWGVAVMGAVMRAADPGRVVAALREVVR